MSRDWKPEEGISRGAIERGGAAVVAYDCAQHDVRNSAIQVPIAIDGLTVATSASGPAQQCVDGVLGGLTIDRLRWIYSSHTYERPPERSKSKPQIVCPKARTTFRAISFSIPVRING